MNVPQIDTLAVASNRDRLAILPIDLNTHKLRVQTRVYQLSNIFVCDLTVGVPHSNHARVTARRHQLRIGYFSVLRRPIELGVHKHDIERLHAFNDYLACFFIKAPNSRHHIIRAGHEATTIVAPVNRAHISLGFNLSVRVMLNVGQVSLQFPKLEVRFSAEVPHRRSIVVSPSDQQPLFGVELGGGNL